MPEFTTAECKTERSALIFAQADQDFVAVLSAAFRANNIRTVQVNLLSKGLSILYQRPSSASPPNLVIILDGLSGLNRLTIAKAVRGLPGLSNLPIIFLGDTPVQFTRCATFTFPVEVEEVCQRAMTDPDTWPTTMTETSTSPSQDTTIPIANVADHSTTKAERMVFDPTPLRRFNTQGPEIRNKILAILRRNLLRARSEFPRLLSPMDFLSLENEAHKLTGSSGSIGAAELSHACAELEQFAHNGDQLNCRSTVAAVVMAIERLTERLAVEYPEV
jgi:HPt (histidine-containing phosphotransfer) domain-containing protein